MHDSIAGGRRGVIREARRRMVETLSTGWTGNRGKLAVGKWYSHQTIFIFLTTHKAFQSASTLS